MVLNELLNYFFDNFFKRKILKNDLFFFTCNIKVVNPEEDKSGRIQKQRRSVKKQPTNFEKNGLSLKLQHPPPPPPSNSSRLSPCGMGLSSGINASGGRGRRRRRSDRGAPAKGVDRHRHLRPSFSSCSAFSWA